MEGDFQVADRFGELAVLRPDHPDLLIEAAETVNEFDALVVGAATSQHGIEVGDAKRGLSHAVKC